MSKNADNQKTVTLDDPLKRGGDKKVETIIVRRPTAGELRGTRLSDVANIDVVAMIKVLPRITIPALTEHELDQMNPADFTALGVEVANFLEQKKGSLVA